MAMLEAVPARFLNSKVRILGAALRARSLNQWKLLHRINKIGKNCNIHPTAWIEFSTLGDNVTVGAGSVITGSLLGESNYIEHSTTVFFSVTGERCHVGVGATLRFALLYPGVGCGARLISYAVCGRDSVVPDGVTLCDYRIDGRNVSVMKDGAPVDTGSRVSGACLGHGVYLAAGCVVGPGRAIPNGMRIAPERSRYISSWDADGNIPGHQRIGVSSAPEQ
jgi:NDP-sugar pyrophosphorylase family protein